MVPKLFGIFAMVPKWNGCELNDMVPTFSEWFRRFGILILKKKIKGPRKKLIISFNMCYLFSCHGDAMVTVDGNPKLIL